MDDKQIEDMRAKFVELGPDQVRTLLSSGGLPPEWNQGATQWLAEKDPNSETADPAEAAPAPSLTEQAVATDQGSTAKPV